MPFRQYTQCYQHTSGDKPFNENDLAGFVAGTSAPGLIVAVLAFLSGNFAVGFIAIAIQYAATIVAVANEWLFHRLVCLTGDQCAVGKVESLPRVDTLLGAFDNDQFFDIRLMPHRHEDEYKAPNDKFFRPTGNPSVPVGTPPWQRLDPGPGPSLDGLTEHHPQNDIFLDGFQGSTLLQPTITDLPYTPVAIDDTTVNSGLPSATVNSPFPPGTTMTRSTLHCEAEGNFWVAMKQTAAWQGIATAAGGAAGAAAGAAAGCAIGGLFGGFGCIIGAIIGFIAGLLAGSAAGAYVAANAAFNSNPGDVNDANVGDLPLGPLQTEDEVVVFGTHVYDGFHTGWHEIHPLKAIIKFAAADPLFKGVNPYVEWNPNPTTGIGSLSVSDVQQGLASPAFAEAARIVKRQWCDLVQERFAPPTIAAQGEPQNRWSIHPAVDGCEPDNPPPPR